MKPSKKPVKKTVKKSAPSKKKTAVKKPEAKKVKAKPSSATAKKALPLKKASVKVPLTGGPGMDRLSCEVVEKGGTSFVIVINRARNFFDINEMRSLVQMCHAARNEVDAAVRMYTWFQGRRKDVLIDTEIVNAADPALKTIYHYLVTHYSIKK
jgi:hypothetical protein